MGFQMGLNIQRIYIDDKKMSSSNNRHVSIEFQTLHLSNFRLKYCWVSHAPRPTSDPSRPLMEPLVDGVLGFVQT